MATEWPMTLPDPFMDFYEEWDMPTTKTVVEMGIEKVRPLFTEAHRTYTVTFPVLTADQKDDMTDFFEDIGWGGGDITWTHPASAAVVYVRLDGSLVFRGIGNNEWTTTFRLKRVPNAVIT